MRIVFRTISAPMLGEMAEAALRLAREAGIAGVRLGPRSASRLLETGLVLDGPERNVKALDGRLQKELRRRKIPFVRREVSVIRPDPGKVAWMSSSPPTSVVTEERAQAPAPPAPAQVIEVHPANVNPTPLEIQVEAPIIRMQPVEVNIRQEPALPTPVTVTVEPSPPVEVRVSLPDIRIPEVVFPAWPALPTPIVEVNLPALAPLAPPTIQVNVPAPEIRVELPANPAPVVHVNVDLRPIEALAEAFMDGISRVVAAMKAPVVKVDIPPQPAPQITVEAPVIKVPDVKVDVHVPAPGPVKKTIVRDGQGRIREVIETPID